MFELQPKDQVIPEVPAQLSILDIFSQLDEKVRKDPKHRFLPNKNNPVRILLKFKNSAIDIDPKDKTNICVCFYSDPKKSSVYSSIYRTDILFFNFNLGIVQLSHFRDERLVSDMSFKAHHTKLSEDQQHQVRGLLNKIPYT